MKASTKVVVAGSGGNIGSHAVPHLARMEEIGQITLIDMDVYESKNTVSQDITPKEIGQPKVEVQAQRIRQINPKIEVEAINNAVQNIPLGRLRGDIIIGCLDNNAARLCMNEASWHLGGIPYIDCGVRAEGLLARVNVFRPGADFPCLECPWDQRDYERLGQIYPCHGGGVEFPATNSPSSLGALAASVAAIECRKILSKDWEQVVAGKQLLIDALNHKHYLIALPRNPNCRFRHDIWEIEQLTEGPGEISIGVALGLEGGTSNSTALQFGGTSRFITRLRCWGCRNEKPLLYLSHRLSSKQMMCQRCGMKMAAGGFDTADGIKAGNLSPKDLRRTLKSLGFQSGDVFKISGPRGCQHFEVGPQGASSSGDSIGVKKVEQERRARWLTKCLRDS